ncbi:MAG TPA: HAD family hydrolase, partial [Solirubrobacteraceae bacterium]|nr:HAD family hydrolase [Solirubrobacteraceae bacterium]
LRGRAIFLDRDGVLNVRPPEHEYVRSAAEFHWLPGAAQGAARLGRAGYLLTVVSNQRGLARGLVTRDVLEEIEVMIQDELRAQGARIEAFRYCPHDLDAGCSCRKPQPGMILALAEELSLDTSASWTIGDSVSDMAAGRAAGTRTELVGDEWSSGIPEGSGADLAAPSLLAASELILSQGEARPGPGRARG